MGNKHVLLPCPSLFPVVDREGKAGIRQRIKVIAVLPISSGFGGLVSPLLPPSGLWGKLAPLSLSLAQMVSIIAQERLLGAALGGVMAAAITFEERKCIYRSVSTNQKHVATQWQEVNAAKFSP
ncbi:hypothetical protein EJ110_NYTH46946 [Nymphaea thermarum]|nr:hypothetical protein EJ110_NYTH46946 [Nymphaea thermarum]